MKIGDLIRMLGDKNYDDIGIIVEIDHGIYHNSFFAKTLKNKIGELAEDRIRVKWLSVNGNESYEPDICLEVISEENTKV